MLRVHLLNIARHIQQQQQQRGLFNLKVVKCLFVYQASLVIKGRIFSEPLLWGCSRVIVKYTQTLSLELPCGIQKSCAAINHKKGTFSTIVPAAGEKKTGAKLIVLTFYLGMYAVNFCFSLWVLVLSVTKQVNAVSPWVSNTRTSWDKFLMT